MNTLQFPRTPAQPPTVPLIALTGLLGLLAAAVPSGASAQALPGAPSVLASGLQRPAKIIQSPLGHTLVAEVGTAAPNTSRISILDGEGARRTLVSGLPSANSAANVLAGVSGLYLRGRTLFVSIGEGNPTLPGPVPRTEVVNPNPASPLFSCVLAVQFSADAERTTTGIELTLADHQALKDGQQLIRRDAEGNRIRISLVVDFPDYVAEPVPALATNVRHSQPYGLVVDDTHVYVVDGGYNKVHKADLATGISETLVSFPNVPNPRFGTLGGPTMEVVPTSIRWDGGRLAVSLLSGFPFPAGTSQVVGIDAATGAVTPLIGGLTSAVDVLPVREDDVTVGYLVLEFSLAQLAGAPGQLRWFDAAGTASALLAGGLATPATMVQDRASGAVVVGLINPGQLVAVELP